MDLLKKLTYKNLRLNKKRSIVTIIGIMLSVALLTAVSTMAISLHSSLVNYTKDSGGDYHYAYMNVPKEDLTNFEYNRNIESMCYTSNIGHFVLEGSKNARKPYGCVLGLSETGFTQLHIKLLEGRFPENTSEVVVSNHVKTNGRVTYQVGDTITVSTGQRVTLSVSEVTELLLQNNVTEEQIEEFLEAYEADWILSQNAPLCVYEVRSGQSICCEKLINEKTVTYTVVGICERPGYMVEGYSAPGYSFLTKASEPGDTVTVYARLTSAGLRNHYTVTANILGVDAGLFKAYYEGDDSHYSTEELMAFAETLANTKYEFGRNNALLTYEAIWPPTDVTKVLMVCVGIVAAIIMVTSVFCIRNSFSISITEKIKQYGMLSSIGATKKQIRKSVLYEGFLLGLVGVPLGLFLGLFASFILVMITNLLLGDMMSATLQLSISWVAIVFGILLGAVTIYFSALGSALKASRITPISAIRSQNEIKIRSKKLRTPKLIRKIWGVGGVVSYKNMKRNKRKYRTSTISIAICTMTFIVISYFMSMCFDMVEMLYGSRDYSLLIQSNTTHQENGTADKVFEAIQNIEGITCHSKITSVTVSSHEIKYTDFMLEQYEKQWGEKPRDLDYELLVLSDEAYAAYCKEAKISVSSGDVVLINYDKISVVNEKTQRVHDAMVQQTSYEDGDTLTLYTETWERLEGDDYERVEHELQPLSIAGVTDVRPFGYRYTYGTILLVTSESTAASAHIELTGNNTTTRLFLLTDQADKVQDQIDVVLQENAADDGGFYISNYDASLKATKRLYLLIGVFTYGFIAVIALIGVTNIINTISTGMELRSSEFATFKSIGMTTKEFNRMIRLESIFIGAKALLVGLPIGIGITLFINYLENTYDMYMEYHFPYSAVLISVAAVFLLLFFIMRLSVRKMRGRNIIETIKNENI